MKVRRGDAGFYTQYLSSFVHGFGFQLETCTRLGLVVKDFSVRYAYIVMHVALF